MRWPRSGFRCCRRQGRGRRARCPPRGCPESPRSSRRGVRPWVCPGQSRDRPPVSPARRGRGQAQPARLGRREAPLALQGETDGVVVRSRSPHLNKKLRSHQTPRAVVDARFAQRVPIAAVSSTWGTSEEARLWYVSVAPVPSAVVGRVLRADRRSGGCAVRTRLYVAPSAVPEGPPHFGISRSRQAEPQLSPSRRLPSSQSSKGSS